MLIIITMAEQGKVSGFRLQDIILTKLDELQKMEVIKNRTDGVVKAVNRFYLEEFWKEFPFLKMLGSITHSTYLVEDWGFYNAGDCIILRGDDPDEEYIVTKEGESHAKIVRKSEDKILTVIITYEDNISTPTAPDENVKRVE